MTLWSGTVDKEEVAVQVRPVANGFKLSFRGAQIVAYVYTATRGRGSEADAGETGGRLGKDRALSDAGSGGFNFGAAWTGS